MWRGGHLWHIAWRANAPNSTFSKLYCTLLQLVYAFMLSFWMTRGQRERQVMPLLVLLIKSVLLLIIFQISFSFNLMVASWRLSPEFLLPNFFSLAMGAKMVAAWSTESSENVFVWVLHPVLIVDGIALSKLIFLLQNSCVTGDRHRELSWCQGICFWSRNIHLLYKYSFYSCQWYNYFEFVFSQWNW